MIKTAEAAICGHEKSWLPQCFIAFRQLPYLSCPRLTPREYEVLDHLASGLSDREIAEKLIVSEETARTYTKRLLRTLISSRVQAVLKGMRCGMVRVGPGP